MPNWPRRKINRPFRFFAFFSILAVAACSCGDDSAEVEPADETPQVVLLDDQGVTLATVTVEIADSSAERQEGLMNRESLGEDAGMLFVFPSDTNSAFWMRNTLISLDMIFIDANGTVVDIIADAVPLSEELLRPDSNYRYVLEVNAGFAADNGIIEGSRVQLPEGLSAS